MESTYAALCKFTDQLLDVAQLQPVLWSELTPSDYARIKHPLRQRIDALYRFVEQQTRYSKEASVSLRLLGESALWLLELRWCSKPCNWEASAAFLRQCAERPDALLRYDQLFCTPDSTERRIQQVLQDIEETGAKVLFLGDDDLGSVALASQFSGEIHVCEFDPRLLSFIQSQAANVQCHEIDLVLGGIPSYLQESFDAVVLDPPWDDYQAWCFLQKARLCLKPDPQARIYLSFCPLFLEFSQKKLHRFFQRLAQVGLTLESMKPATHLYSLASTEFQNTLLSHIPDLESPLLDVLKTLPLGFSHLYVLRKTQHTQRHSWGQRMFRWWHSQ